MLFRPPLLFFATSLEGLKGTLTGNPLPLSRDMPRTHRLSQIPGFQTAHPELTPASRLCRIWCPGQGLPPKPNKDIEGAIQSVILTNATGVRIRNALLDSRCKLSRRAQR